MQNLDLVILKVLVSNKKYALEFIHQCTERVFIPDLWRFAKIIIDYLRVYKEVPTKRIIIEKLKAQKNDSLINYVEATWAELDSISYDDKEYKHDLEKIKNRFSEKLILNLKSNLDKDSIDIKKSVADINNVLQNIKNVNQIKAYEQNTLKGALDDFRNRYVAKLKDPFFGAGLMTGYSFLDYTTGGLRPSEMLLVGAETGQGKSMMMMNMAINMWMGGNTIEMNENFKQGCNVLLFSLEMPLADYQDRVMSRLAMVPQKGIRDAKLDKDQESKLGRAARFIEKYPYDFEIVDVPRGVSIDTIETVYEDICSKGKKPDVVVIDYLNLMEASKTSNDIQDWLYQEKISEELHEFCRVHELVLLSAVQLNDAKQSGKIGESSVGMHRIGRSKGILRNANFALQIEKRAGEDQLPNISIHMIKSRRTELTRGILHRDFSCCAILDNNINQEEEKFVDVDDISFLLDKNTK